MKLLVKSPATLGDTADPDMKLLEFPGERALRLPRADLAAMIRGGSVKMRRENRGVRLCLTTEGHAALRRLTAGNFAGQHGEITQDTVLLDGQRQAVTVNADESALSSLARIRTPEGGKWLGANELAAGERLRADFERGMLQPRVTASWDPSRGATGRNRGGNGASEFGDAALAARDRVNRAVAAVGPELSGVLVDICCFLKGLEQVERERGWPRRSAKLMLKTALGILDRHYNPPPPAALRSGKILQWGTEGYRPSM
jgi:Domain of unknown function (DUF6456)